MGVGSALPISQNMTYETYLIILNLSIKLQIPARYGRVVKLNYTMSVA
jgi:hypothetical protein